MDNETKFCLWIIAAFALAMSFDARPDCMADSEGNVKILTKLIYDNFKEQGYAGNYTDLEIKNLYQASELSAKSIADVACKLEAAEHKSQPLPNKLDVRFNY